MKKQNSTNLIPFAEYDDIALSCENLTSAGVFYNSTYLIKDGISVTHRQCGFTGTISFNRRNMQAGETHSTLTPGIASHVEMLVSGVLTILKEMQMVLPWP